jgi:hypothetical protein
MSPAIVPRESVVLCEGYLDRAFWGAWLRRLGCTVERSGGIVTDARGLKVSDGQYMYRSRSREYVRIIPCGGRRQVLEQARRQLQKRAIEPTLPRLVLTVDPDIDAHAAGSATGMRIEDIRDLVRRHDARATITERGDVALDAGECLVSLVRWETDDPPTWGVPSQQTLERLVCAAIVAAYPDRGPTVDGWLQSRSTPPPPTVKAIAWSHMAGWYAEAGCEAFYRVVWDDPKVETELVARLHKCGALTVAESLAE